MNVLRSLLGFVMLLAQALRFFGKLLPVKWPQVSLAKEKIMPEGIKAQDLQALQAINLLDIIQWAVKNWPVIMELIAILRGDKKP